LWPGRSLRASRAAVGDDGLVAGSAKPEEHLAGRWQIEEGEAELAITTGGDGELSIDRHGLARGRREAGNLKSPAFDRDFAERDAGVRQADVIVVSRLRESRPDHRPSEKRSTESNITHRKASHHTLQPNSCRIIGIVQRSDAVNT